MSVTGGFLDCGKVGWNLFATKTTLQLQASYPNDTVDPRISEIYRLPLGVYSALTRLRAESLLSSKIRGKERKTSKRLSRSHITLTVTLAGSLVLRCSSRIFEEKRDCSQSRLAPADRVFTDSVKMSIYVRVVLLCVHTA